MKFKQPLIFTVCIVIIFLSIQVGYSQQFEPPLPEPSHWTGLIGTYKSPDGDLLYVRENKGELEILFPLLDPRRRTESLLFRGKEYEIISVKETESDSFQLPPASGLEVRKIQINRDEDGFGARLDAGKKSYQRLFYGPEKGKTFQIQPVKSLQELQSETKKAVPPKEKGDFLKPDLVEVIRLDKTILLDLKYAIEDNFMGIPLYTQSRAFLQRPVAECLVRAHQKLQSIGYGLIIFDAYRPWFVTKMFWDATPKSMKNFVANPQTGSRHNRGSAVDVGLYALSNKEPIYFGGGFDEFSERSYTDFPGGTSRERWFREILRQAMESENFVVYEDEWWHFDYQSDKKYPIMNIPFEDIR